MCTDWNMIEVTINFVEIVISCYFAFCIFDNASKPKQHQWFSFLVIVLLGVLLQCWADASSLPHVHLLPSIAIFIVFSVLVLHARILPAVLWACMNCMLLRITYIATSVVVGTILGMHIDRLFLPSHYQVMLLMASKLAQLLLTELVIKLARQWQFSTTTHKGSSILLAAPAFSIVLLFVLWAIEYHATQEIVLYLNLIICALLASNNFYLWFSHFAFVKATEEIKALRACGKVVEMQLRDQEEIADMYTSTCALKHEMNEHLHTINGYIQLRDYSKLDAYMQKLMGDMKAIEAFHTGNKTLDALLGSKVVCARRQHIHITVEAVVPKQLQIYDEHLSVLVGSLFSNAIDACMKITDETKRQIELCICYHKHSLLVNVENATDGSESMENNTWCTTKAMAREHGFGLKSIDRIVSQYDGFCKRKHSANVFVCQIRLPDTPPK